MDLQQASTDGGHQLTRARVTKSLSMSLSHRLASAKKFHVKPLLYGSAFSTIAALTQIVELRQNCGAFRREWKHLADRTQPRRAVSGKQRGEPEQQERLRTRERH